MKTLNDRTLTKVGTPEYMAPEIVMGKEYSRSIDLWAIGILLYEMTTT
jgi:serine/threonine protein kinase